MKLILASHRAVMVLIAAGGAALLSLLGKPVEGGLHPALLIGFGLVIGTLMIAIIGFSTGAYRTPSLHQALGALMVLTGIIVMTL